MRNFKIFATPLNNYKERGEISFNNILYLLLYIQHTTISTYDWGPLVAQLVKNPPAMGETWVQSLGWEDLLEKGKATHSSVLAWRIPWGCKESDTSE